MTILKCFFTDTNFSRQSAALYASPRQLYHGCHFVCGCRPPCAPLGARRSRVYHKKIRRFRLSRLDTQYTWLGAATLLSSNVRGSFHLSCVVRLAPGTPRVIALILPRALTRTPRGNPAARVDVRLFRRP